jgi:hypothetical protein
MSDIGLTASLNERSIESVRLAIARKTSTTPYFATNNTIRNSVTDMDHQPYQRFFRGVYYYPEPIIFEREAGYRPINNECYNIVADKNIDEEPDHCFEVACSTIFPCRPNYLKKYADKDRLEVMLNRACIPQYR